MKSRIGAQLLLTAFDKNHDTIDPSYFETYKTVEAEYYNEASYMKERVYETYKNGSIEIHYRTPVPRVE